MKTQSYTAGSLDGFIATDDHSLDWLFPLGDLNEISSHKMRTSVPLAKYVSFCRNRQKIRQT